MDTFRPFSLMAQFELQLLLLRHRILPSRQSRRGDMVRNSMSSLVVPSSSSPPWLCCPAHCPGEPPGVRAHPVHVHEHQQVLASVPGVHTGGGAPQDSKGASMPHPQCQSCAFHPWLLSVVNIKLEAKRDISIHSFFYIILHSQLKRAIAQTFPFL